MTVFHWVLLIVVTQRSVELLISRRNAIRLMASGGTEHGASHYIFIVAIHVAWIASMYFFIPADQPATIPLIFLFFAIQLMRVWVIVSLGRHWTTRVITVPGHVLVDRGPYRWLRHPNYVVVMLEIVLLPIAFDAWQIAVIFGLLNGSVLAYRIRIENAALAIAAGDEYS